MTIRVSYHQVAVTRQRELPMRVALAAVIGAGAWAVTGAPLVVAAWFAAMLATQVIDSFVTAGMRRDPGYVPTPGAEQAYLGWIALNVVVYEAITPFCWMSGGL